MPFQLVKGSGTSKVSGLNAFDAALMAAGVGDLNLVRLSSILPVGYKEGDFLKGLTKGMKLPIAYAEYTTEKGLSDGHVCAGVAVAIPYDSDKSGLIMEHSVCMHGLTETYVTDRVEQALKAMIKEGMELRCRTDYGVKLAIISAKIERDSCVSVFAGVALEPNQDWRY